MNPLDQTNYSIRLGLIAPGSAGSKILEIMARDTRRNNTSERTVDADACNGCGTCVTGCSRLIQSLGIPPAGFTEECQTDCYIVDGS